MDFIVFLVAVTVGRSIGVGLICDKATVLRDKIKGTINKQPFLFHH